MLPETTTRSPRAKAPELSRTAMPAVASTTQPPPSVKAASVKATPLIAALLPSGSSLAWAIGIGLIGAGGGVEATVGVGVRLGDGVGVCVGVAVGVAIGVAVGLAVGLTDGDADGVSESVGSGGTLGRAEAVGVGVGETDGAGVPIGAAAAF